MPSKKRFRGVIVPVKKGFPTNYHNSDPSPPPSLNLRPIYHTSEHSDVLHVRNAYIRVFRKSIMSETNAIIQELRASGLSDDEIYQWSVTRATEYFGIPEHSEGYKIWSGVMHHFESIKTAEAMKMEDNRAKRAAYAREYRNTKRLAEETHKGKGFGWYWKYFASEEEFEAFKKLPEIRKCRKLIEFAKLE